MSQTDWIAKLDPLLKNNWRLKDGKVHAPEPQLATDLNWVFSNVDFDCTVWNKIYHEIITGTERIHSHCHDCIKIVAKPPTLRDLVKIETIQKSMLYPCKCGIDTRPNTPVIYGAFWYNRGFDEARMRYKKIKERFVEAELEHVPLIIKRACTEFENRHGDSRLWPPPTEDQLQEEKELAERIVYHAMPPNQIPEMVENHTHYSWVQWAWQNGDETYLDFTDGEPMYEPLVTYDPEDETDVPTLPGDGDSAVSSDEG